jgi:SAM-dependent methyltransferase
LLLADAPAEAVRNRLLRRADWRFLLPNPSPARSICFASGPLASAVAAISEQATDASSQGVASSRGDGGYDLAVVANPDRAALQAAWQALKPGGFCYGEWTRPLPGGASAVRRRLASAGFAAPACYWPLAHPDRGPVGAWLPVDAPAALRYYAADRRRALPEGQRRAYQLKWRLWSLAQGAGLALPLCAIARKPAGAGGLAEPGPADSLLAEWEAPGLGGPPQRLARLLLTGGLHAVNRAVTLVFAGDEAEPRLAVKQARVPAAAGSLAHEAAVLDALHAAGRIPPAGAPRTLFLRDGPAPALGQSIARGAPIWLVLRRDNYARLAAQVTEWQVQLLQGGPPAPPAAWWDRLAAPHLGWFGAWYGEIAGAGQLRRAEALLRQLGSLPLACEHRDFAPGNVWLDGDRIVVIDWECAELAGLPALDLIYFLTFLTLAVEGVHVHGEIDMRRARAVYRDAFDAATPNGAVVAGCLHRYCAAAGIDPAALRPLRLLTWLMQAHLRRHAAAAQARTPAEAWGRSLFAQLWEEELAGAAEATGAEASSPAQTHRPAPKDRA